jgi:hypothetical protein
MSFAGTGSDSVLPKLILFAGSSGCKTADALARIRALVGKHTTIATRDVEDYLVSHVKDLIVAYDREPLGDQLRSTFAPNKTGPKLEATVEALEIQDLFWELPRDLVSTLWLESAERALRELGKEDAQIRVLKTHLVYYRGETFEFFTPAAATVFRHFDVHRIIVLIDDLYDMYVRLTGPRQVFDFNLQLHTEHENILEVEGKRRDAGQTDGNTSALEVPAELYRLAISIVVRNLLRALNWREKEILAAEALGSDLQAPVFVIAAKHPTATGAALVLETDREPNTYLTYLSHPISRPRKAESDGKWPPFVPEYHAFVHALRSEVASVRCIPIMPTAIDEFRIRSVEEQFTAGDGNVYRREVYVPLLRTRWPLLETEELMYSTPTGMTADDIELQIQDIFNPVIRPDSDERLFPNCSWDGLPQQTRQEISGMLHVLMISIRQQMANRDHLLVRQCPGFLLYRPLHADYEKSFSRGVQSEIDNWERINRLFSNKLRPILFVHHDTDLARIDLKSSDWSAIEREVMRDIENATGYPIDGIPDAFRRSEKNWFRSLIDREDTISGGMPPRKANVFRAKRRDIERLADARIQKRRAHVLTGGAASVPGTVCVIHPFSRDPKQYDVEDWTALVQAALRNWPASS